MPSGVAQLDRLLDGLYIGDNVVWYDDAGSLSTIFCLNFMQASWNQNKPLIYVTFDRSPSNLLDKLGVLAENRHLIIMDCFSYGKGKGADVFLKFYQGGNQVFPCQFIVVEEPWKMDRVMEALYNAHAQLEGDVRFIFESLTGMQDVWDGEEHILKFYSQTCPRLYELETIAYWIIEKRAHSSRLRAQINQVAQVAVDLAVKRGKTFLTVLKAEKRKPETLDRPYYYWAKDMNVSFDFEDRSIGRIDLGSRLKDLRKKRGIPQTELARLIGVTSSTISQVEGNLIFPSLPALYKMAEVLSVDVAYFFQDLTEDHRRVLFHSTEAMPFPFQDFPKDAISGKQLIPIDVKSKAEAYLIDIMPGKRLASHFFSHKGEEMGYLIRGKLEVQMNAATRAMNSGDTLYLTTEMPSSWLNTGRDTARLLWIKIH